MVRLGSIALVVLASTLSAGGAAAAPTRGEASGTSARALDLFEQSARAYREGRFEEVVVKLLEARKLKPEPVLLYNLARAYEALGRWDEAAGAYAQYLEEEPAAADRKAIEGRIATLRAQAAELAAARRPVTSDEASAEAEPGAARTPERERDTFPSFVPWAIAGAGAAMAATGIGFGVAAQGKHDDAVGEPVQRRAADLQDSAETLAQVSTVMVVIGAVLVASGVSWLVLRATSSRTGARPSWTAASPRALGWTF